MFSVSENDLEEINELCLALKPLKLAIENLSKQDATLLYADQVLQFVISKLDQQNSDISQAIKEAFKRQVLKRRQHTLIHLMEYLDDPPFFELNFDSFGIRIVKQDVINLAISLFKRLFPTKQAQVIGNVPN